MLSYLKVYPSFSSCHSCVTVLLRRVLASPYEIVDDGWDSLLPPCANWSAISFPAIPEGDVIHWKTIFLFLDSSLSCLHNVVDVLSMRFDCIV